MVEVLFERNKLNSLETIQVNSYNPSGLHSMLMAGFSFFNQRAENDKKGGAGWCQVITHYS